MRRKVVTKFFKLLDEGEKLLDVICLHGHYYKSSVY